MAAVVRAWKSWRGAVLLGAFLVLPPFATAMPGATAVVKRASRPEQLLPSRFIAEKTVRVDLDLDGDLDAVVVGVDGVVPAPDTMEEGDGEGERVLLFATKDASGFRQVGLGRNALLCRRCGGAFWGVVPAPFEISVSKNVVVVTQEAGSRELTSWTHRYRLQSGVVRLIGTDRVTADRLNGSVVSVSTNLLTGLTITTVDGDVDPSSENPKAGRKVGKPRVVALESVEIS
jgi:hypothetical protein